MQWEIRLMLDRRRFVHGAIHSAGALAAIGLSVQPIAVCAAAMRFHKVIFDADFHQSRLFAADARSLGANVHAIRGDVTDLWHDDLYHRWRRAPAAIAGMTRFDSLFILEMMAADVGMRVIFRVHHHPRDDGSTAHEVFGTLAYVRPMRLGESEHEWVRTIARSVMSWPTEKAAISKACSNIGEARARAIGPRTLISWIIAPVSPS
jgi:hypothetical protein